MFRKQMCITGDIMSEKAMMTQNEFNSLLPAEDRANLKFSNGWLSRFKKWNNFKRCKIHSENGDACESAIEEELAILELCFRLTISVTDSTPTNSFLFTIWP